MQLVIYTIVLFIVIGGVGMYAGNRKVDRSIARQRWLKYIVYIFITSFVVISIWFGFLLAVAAFIVLAGYYEIVRTIDSCRRPWLALLIYTVVVAGFVFYSWKFEKKFQFFIYLQVLAFDAFSQVTGQLIGKTPITPRISPAKTAEGLLGGLSFSVLSALLISNWMGISLVTAMAYGIFTAIFGFAGDILASFYKRTVGIKDYSNLLPGQGGFLDRFDSFIMATFCYSLIYLFKPNEIPA